MEIIFEENQPMNQFSLQQQNPASFSFSQYKKIPEQNQNFSQFQNPTLPQKDSPSSSSSSCNFEKLFSEIIEAQSDIESIDDEVQKFFTNYISNIINPNEMKNTINIIQQNSALQSKLIEKFVAFLKQELKENKEKVDKDMKITKQIETKTYQVARAKDMFRELNEMLHSDIISHHKEIKKVDEENKKIQKEVQEYEKELEMLNNENKKSYKEELNLLDTVMSFGKKIYTTYVTREEKKKEKNMLEEEINKLMEEKKNMEMKYKEEFNDIEKMIQEEENDFNIKKDKINEFLNSFPGKNSKCDSLINSLKVFYSSNLKKYSSLIKPTKNKSAKESSPQISISLQDLKNHLNNCDHSILQEISNTIEIIRTVHPYLSIPPQLNIDNILEVVESIITQISCIINEETPQEKINIERENQMEEIGVKIADIYRDKFIKSLFINTLKVNCLEEKKKKDAEKKMKELKDKEEKLKRLQLKYINEKTNKNNISNNNNIDSQISDKSNNSSSFFSINDDLDFIIKDKESPKKEPAKEKEKNKKPSPIKPSLSTSSEINSSVNKSGLSTDNTSISNPNSLNVSIQNKKKEEKKSIKNININIIPEEDPSKSKSKSKSNNENRYKERKEPMEPEKKNKQKSLKKKGKPSQLKKKNKKKRKYDNDSSDDNVSNKDEDSFMNQILGISSDYNESNEKKIMKNCETERKREKSDMKFGINSFKYFEESSKENNKINNFDLNDLDFLTELGEEVNKTEKNYGFGRKFNYKNK